MPLESVGDGRRVSELIMVACAKVVKSKALRMTGIFVLYLSLRTKLPMPLGVAYGFICICSSWSMDLVTPRPPKGIFVIPQLLLKSTMPLESVGDDITVGVASPRMNSHTTRALKRHMRAKYNGLLKR